MKQQRHIYRQSNTAAPPTPPNTRHSTGQQRSTAQTKKRKQKTGWLVFLAVAAALYLFATAFSAIKFNSLNPARTAWGLWQVVVDKQPYHQVAGFPYRAFVATPENSEETLKAMMAEQGYQYQDLESQGSAFIFSKDTLRVRVVVSGNAYFTRWAFSKESVVENEESMPKMTNTEDLG